MHARMEFNNTSINHKMESYLAAIYRLFLDMSQVEGGGG